MHLKKIQERLADFQKYCKHWRSFLFFKRLQSQYLVQYFIPGLRLTHNTQNNHQCPSVVTQLLCIFYSQNTLSRLTVLARCDTWARWAPDLLVNRKLIKSAKSGGQRQGCVVRLIDNTRALWCYYQPLPAKRLAGSRRTTGWRHRQK